MRLMTFNRLIKRLLNGPTKRVYSITQRLYAYAHLVGPFGHGHCFSTKRDLPAFSRVIVLLTTGGPFNIARKISNIIVDSFYCVGRGWSWPDMLIKFWKRLKPAIINQYPPAAIIFKRRFFRFCAALLYSLPDRVFRKVAHVVDVVILDAMFPAKTPAALGIPRPQTLPNTDSCFPARTPTFPKWLGMFVASDPTDDGESFKYLTSQVNSGLTPAACRSPFQVCRIGKCFVSASALAFPSWDSLSSVGCSLDDSKFSKNLSGKIDESHNIYPLFSIMYHNTYMEGCQWQR